MIWTAFSVTIYAPLYNSLVFLIDIIPGGSVGFSIIILTLVVKMLLFPLAKRATRTQVVLKKIAPLLEETKKKYKDDQKEQVSNMLRIYKEYNVHPLSGILIVLLQLPIVIGLYWVFLRGGLPVINEELLYSFVNIPNIVQMDFLGMFNLGEKSIILAVLVAATQFAVVKATFDAPKITSKPGESLKDDIMRSLHLQAKYMLPVLLGVFAYIFTAAVALHWIVGNLFMLVQDVLVKKQLRDIESTKEQ